MTTVTVSIGRNIGAEPMPITEWVNFREAVRGALASSFATVFVDAARSVGEWEGVSEASATWVASVEPIEIPYLERRFSAMARDYLQDAIAFTVGETFLLGGE